MVDQDVMPDEPRRGLSRRQLIRGGVAGAGLLWVAPVVSGVGLTAANAATASGNPGSSPSGSVTPTTTTSTPPPGNPITPQVVVQPETFVKPTPSPTVKGITITKPRADGTLPFTGTPVDAIALVAGGLVAAGGAAYAGSKMRARQTGIPTQRDGDVDPEPPAA